MIKVLSVISATLLILVLYNLYHFIKETRLTQPSTAIDQSQVNPSLDDSKLSNLTHLQINNYEYRYSKHQIKDLGSLELFMNLPDWLSSSDLKSNNNCSFLINAGFYSTIGQPIGWLKPSNASSAAQNKQLNKLFNGFLYLSPESKIVISDTVEEHKAVTFGLQSGPLLILNSQVLNLNLTQDQPKRRMVAAIDKTGSLWFVVVLSSKSTTVGPYLSDLPQIINQIGIINDLTFQSALNLDGGSASAFLSDQVSIYEIKPIGSYFCERSR